MKEEIKRRKQVSNLSTFLVKKRHHINQLKWIPSIVDKKVEFDKD
jgi:hypothetical protein